MNELGERTIWIDCDVIQADGGTRTASITGGFVALVLAMKKMQRGRRAEDAAGADYVAATSVGVVAGTPMLDLAYDEDSKADVDMNVVKTGDGRFIEVQGTAEGPPFERGALDALLELADAGIRQLVSLQRDDPRRSSAARMTPARTRSDRSWSSRRPIPARSGRSSAILAGVPIEIRTLADFPAVEEPEETGATFAENARLKALYYADALGRPCVADDSGLEIAALDNLPGVHSARWEGEDYAVKFAKIRERLRSAASRPAPPVSSAASRSPIAAASCSNPQGSSMGRSPLSLAASGLRLRPDLLLPAVQPHAR